MTYFFKSHVVTGINKRIAALSFFKGLIALTPETVTAMGLLPVTLAVFLIANLLW
jgi:hypothetical protein